jgi:hypothetical protein
MKNISELPMALFSPHGEGLLPLPSLFSRSSRNFVYLAGDGMNINMLSSVWRRAHGTPRPHLRERDWTCATPRLRSGRVMFSKETVRRFGNRAASIEDPSGNASRSRDSGSCPPRPYRCRCAGGPAVGTRLPANPVQDGIIGMASGSRPSLWAPCRRDHCCRYVRPARLRKIAA